MKSRAKASGLGARVIFELSLLSVRGGTAKVDIGPAATAGCIRLIDCIAFTQDNILRIWEFPTSPLQEFSFYETTPKLSYTAISYVWKGNPVDPSCIAHDHPGYLTAEGAENGDPVSIEVLHLACLASLSDEEPGRYRMISRSEYIWLDRLCIVQTSKEDKSLQITQMYQVYRCCMQCLILPGGIQRVVPLDEETAWSTRAWTLQECLAPQTPVVLFPWTLGTGRMIGNSTFKLRELGPGIGYAIARFIDVVRACVDGPMVFNACPFDSPLREWNKPDIIAAGTKIDIRIFGKGHPDLLALRQARLQFQSSDIRLQRNGVSAGRASYSMLWRCALMRTSSRPVDMVFSIMGLMGVALDPKRFSSDDRLGATNALTSAILNRGGSADWLGLPAKIPPCIKLCTFPQFPETDVAGEARYLISNVPTPARSLDDWFFSSTSWDSDSSEDRLCGSIDEDGYLIFRRRACSIAAGTAVGSPSYNQENLWPLIWDRSGGVWHFEESLCLSSQAFPKIAAIPLWKFADYSLLTEFHPAGIGAQIKAFKLMIVKEHIEGKFDLISYIYVHDEDDVWKARVARWEEYDFAVGGPNLLRN